MYRLKGEIKKLSMNDIGQTQPGDKFLFYVVKSVLGVKE